jgi:hypothetical protein
MKDQATICFASQPIRTHDMEYACDTRKDKPLKGQGTDCPVVKIIDNLCRSGELKVISVCHVATNKSQYHLHPNLLCNDRKKKKNCNDFGVATFKFSNKNGETNINLENLCVRHSAKKNVEEVRKKWSECDEKFDPYGIGFCDAKELNMEYIRLCCQVVFNNDVEKSTILVSDYIFNGPSDIKIEFWDDSREVNVDGANELLYILVRKLSNEQRDVYAQFYDDNGWFKNVEPEKNHHDLAFVFKIPSYQTDDDKVVCNVQLSVKDKEYYKSDVKQFWYVSSGCTKRSFQNAFEADEGVEDVGKEWKKARFPTDDPSFKIPNCENHQVLQDIAATSDSNVQLEDELIFNIGDFYDSEQFLNVDNGENPTTSSMLVNSSVNDENQHGPVAEIGLLDDLIGNPDLFLELLNKQSNSNYHLDNETFNTDQN